MKSSCDMEFASATSFGSSGRRATDEAHVQRLIARHLGHICDGSHIGDGWDLAPEGRQIVAHPGLITPDHVL
jgi:hypothetical protein